MYFHFSFIDREKLLWMVVIQERCPLWQRQLSLPHLLNLLILPQHQHLFRKPVLTKSPCPSWIGAQTVPLDNISCTPLVFHFPHFITIISLFVHLWELKQWWLMNDSTSGRTLRKEVNAQNPRFGYKRDIAMGYVTGQKGEAAGSVTVTWEGCRLFYFKLSKMPHPFFFPERFPLSCIF